MSTWTMVTVGSGPFGNAFAGGIGGLFGTQATLAVTGVLILVAEAGTGVAVLNGLAGDGEYGDQRPAGAPSETADPGLSSVD